MRTNLSWILNVGTHNAVRRVPISSISLTGEVLGQQFESSLERDLIFLMAWNPLLEWFQVQPVSIPYRTPDGRPHTYTPDLLVWFDDRKLIGQQPSKPILCEVKYRADLKNNWKNLKHKFKAAKAYAHAQGWEFRIYTEDRIRTPVLKNIKFLWSYRSADEHIHHHEILYRALEELQEASIAELLDACYEPANRVWRGEGLWTMWCMIARDSFQCDLAVPLSMQTRIWINPIYHSGKG